MFFGGGGGFPFGAFGGMGGQDEEEEQEQTLWAILGVEENATPQQLDEAFKNASEEHKQDPDKVFSFLIQLDELKQAYEILKDPKKREQYKSQV